MIKDNVSYNMMEEMVDYMLKGLMEQAKMCNCERCLTDVRALALNELPPRYVVSHVDKVMTQFELLNIQAQTNIIIAIMGAIEKVSLNPHHNDEM